MFVALIDLSELMHIVKRLIVLHFVKGAIRGGFLNKLDDTVTSYHTSL